MRIDKWLKVSRLTKRREVAKELCDEGDVFINDKLAKASTEVVPGDTLKIIMGRHTITAKVLLSKPYARKDEAKEMFEIISDIVAERE